MPQTCPVQLDPDEPELLNFLGYGWADIAARYLQVRPWPTAAAGPRDAEPQFGKAMIDSLGWAYFRLGDYKTAVAKLQEVHVSLEPADTGRSNDHSGGRLAGAPGARIEAQGPVAAGADAWSPTTRPEGAGGWPKLASPPIGLDAGVPPADQAAVGGAGWSSNAFGPGADEFPSCTSTPL